MGLAQTHTLATMPIYTAVTGVDQWYVIVLTDPTDNKTQETGIVVGSVDVTYSKVDGSDTLGAYSVTASEFYEVGEGLYGLKIGASEFDSSGTWVVRIGDTGAPQANKAIFIVQVFDASVDTLVRSSTPANALDVDSNNRVDVGSWLGSAVTLDANNLPDVNIAAISDDTDAADSLEGAIDNTNDVVLSDVSRVSGSATAANNMELEYDGTGYAGGTTKRSVNVTAWAGTATTISSTSAKPEVDTYSVSDSASAANSVESNIGNLDAAVTTRSAPATAQTISMSTSLPGSPTADTVGAALVAANDNLDAAVTSRSTLARTDLFANDVAIQNDASGYLKLSDGTGTGQVDLTSGLVNLNPAQSLAEGQTAQTVGGSLEITEARWRNKYDEGALSGTETIYQTDGSTPVGERTNGSVAATPSRVKT